MSQGERWRERRGLARTVRFVIWLGPVVLGVVVATIVANLVPVPDGLLATVGWWALVLVAATAAVYAADRYARRLLPVTALLRMSLVFPDRAPPRFRVARKAGRTSELEELVERARSAGASDDRAEAAENILTLVSALNDHDRRTRGHSERVRVYSDLLADEMKLPQDARDRLRWAALLHDVGKITVPEEILNKNGKPDDDEWAVLRSHPEEGARLLGPLHGWLGEWASAVREHHERWDGTGYPRGLGGKDISLGGRVVAVADAYETMLAARAYKRPMTPAAAREELARSSGSHFDPRVVKALMDISIGKLRRTAGPIAWVAQFPFTMRAWDAASPLMQGVSNVAGQIGTIGATVAATAGIAVGAVLGPAAPALIDERPRHRSAASQPDRRGPEATPALSPAAAASPPVSATALPPGVTPSPARAPASVTAVPAGAPRPTTTAPRPTPTTRPPAGATEYSLYQAASKQGSDSNHTATLALRASAPTQRSLYNYDANQDADAGLTIERSTKGFAENDSKKRQDWTIDVGQAIRLDGPMRLTFYSALRNFAAGRGRILVQVRTCAASTGACTVLSEKALDLPNWGGGAKTWVEHTLDLGPQSRTIAGGDSIAMRLVVDGASRDDMWFAFDTTSYASRLVLFRR